MLSKQKDAAEVSSDLAFQREQAAIERERQEKASKEATSHYPRALWPHLKKFIANNFKSLIRIRFYEIIFNKANFSYF